jgi:hypothetical protein
MTQKFRSILMGLALGLTPFLPAKADDSPFIDVYTELDIALQFQSFQKNRVYAIGAENTGFYAQGYDSLEQARNEALNGCVAYIQKKLNVDGDTKCKIFYENENLVEPANQNPNLKDFILPNPDLPLLQADYFGSPQKADAILLFIHGCDGKSTVSDPWFNGWLSTFAAKNLAVVQPDSFADPHPSICGDFQAFRYKDNVLRQRVAQTRRTIDNLKYDFPGKKIYIWGHSEGGLVTQLFDYQVSGIIVSGANCLRPAANIGQTPLYHIIGDNDHAIDLGQPGARFTDDLVQSQCSGYGAKGSKTYSIIPGGDHFVDVNTSALQAGIARILDQF